MTEATGEPVGRPEHADVRFEPTDASFRAILFILLGAVVVLAILQLMVLMFFFQYRNYLAKTKVSAFPLAPAPSTALPREPRLEQIDRLAAIETPNIFDRESANLETLQSYGLSPEEGFMHVPIERAMNLLLERKLLKSRPQPPIDELRRSNGLIDAGESNAGRLYREGPK